LTAIAVGGELSIARTVEARAKELEKDQIISTLSSASPVRRRIWMQPSDGAGEKSTVTVLAVNLPTEFGGPREVDATQVGDIVEWVKDKYWGALSYPPGYSEQLDLIRSKVARQRSAIDQFKEQILTRLQ
jgi:hypothetical protein